MLFLYENNVSLLFYLNLVFNKKKKFIKSTNINNIMKKLKKLSNLHPDCMKPLCFSSSLRRFALSADPPEPALLPFDCEQKKCSNIKIRI